MLLHTGVLLLLCVLLAAPGVLWDALLFDDRPPPGGRAVAFLVLSFASWIVLAFGLCALHLLRPVLVGVLCTTAVSTALIVLARRPRPGLARCTYDGRVWILGVPIAAVLGGLLVIALSPVPGWDAEHYHLTIPRLYVESGGFRRIPYSLQSNWPLGPQLLYALVLLFSDHVSAGLIHFIFGLATGALLIIAGRRASGSAGAWAGLIAVALFWSNPIVQYESTVAYVDLAVAFFFLAGFLAIQLGFDDAPRARTWFFVAGVSAGMLAGSKVNGVISAAVLGAMAVFRLMRSGSSRPGWRIWLLAGGLPAAALSALWPIKSWVLTGNPFYPFFYGHFGGGEWSDDLTRQFSDAMQSMGMGRRWTDYLLLPVRVILSGDNDFAHFYGRLTPAWVVLVPATLWLGRRNPFARMLVASAGLQFVAWGSASQQMRFLLPSIAALCAAAGIALAEAAGRLRLSMALPTFGAAASMWLLVESASVWPSARDWARVYRRQGSTLPGSAMNPTYGYIDSHLPRDARLLLVNTSRGFFVHRDFIADSVFQASQIAEWLGGATTPDEVRQTLRAAGVTHVLFDEAPQGAHYPPALMAMIERRRGLVLLFRDARHGVDLFQICDTATCDAKAS